MINKLKLALVVSHPIQHFCPQYVSFAENENIEFKVFFASRLGLEKYHDTNFKQEISWGNLHIDKFAHEFLNGAAVLQSNAEIDAPGLDKALKDFHPQIIITYGYFQKLQRRAHKWAMKNKVAIAYVSDSEARHKRSRLKELMKYWYLRNYFSAVRYFLTVGDANEDFYKMYDVPAKKMLRMHFPIDINLYKRSWLQKATLRQEVRGKYGITEGEIVLSVVGKLVAWKNQDHIIAALLELEKQNMIFHLFIIGSGEMMQQWKKLAAGLEKSKVYFTGFVNIAELPAYYAATDIYIHPAVIEPHSLAISEAIYMGCPVILSSCCGSYGENDDVQPEKNGYVYRFGDIKELAALIKLLANDSVKRRSFGLYAHEISEKFQLQSHTGIVNDLRSKFFA